MSRYPEFPELSESPTRARGRRSSLTLERLEKLSDLLSGGNTIRAACQFAGISESTFHTWRLRGEERIEELTNSGVDFAEALGEDLTPKALWWRPAAIGEDWPYVVFVVVVERSRAAAEVRMVHAIQQAAQGTAHTPPDWRAAAWWLEHAAAQRYSSRQQIELEAPHPLAQQHVITVDELMDSMAALNHQRNPQRNRVETPQRRKADSGVSVEALNERLKQLGVGDDEPAPLHPEDRY